MLCSLSCLLINFVFSGRSNRQELEKVGLRGVRGWGKAAQGLDVLLGDLVQFIAA